jgi:hypothetical protein
MVKMQTTLVAGPRNQRYRTGHRLSRVARFVLLSMPSSTIFAIFGAVRPWDKPPAAILRKGGVEREQNDPAPLDAERHSMTRGQLAGC